jgi:hypothetical protein
VAFHRDIVVETLQCNEKSSERFHAFSLRQLFLNDHFTNQSNCYSLTFKKTALFKSLKNCPDCLSMCTPSAENESPPA